MTLGRDGDDITSDEVINKRHDIKDIHRRAVY